MTHCTHLLQKKCTVLASYRHVVHTGRLGYLLTQVMQKCGDAQVDACLAQWWHTQQLCKLDCVQLYFLFGKVCLCTFEANLGFSASMRSRQCIATLHAGACQVHLAGRYCILYVPGSPNIYFIFSSIAGLA